MTSELHEQIARACQRLSCDLNDHEIKTTADSVDLQSALMLVDAATKIIGNSSDHEIARSIVSPLRRVAITYIDRLRKHEDADGRGWSHGHSIQGGSK